MNTITATNPIKMEIHDETTDRWQALRNQLKKADHATANAVREIAIAGDMMLALKSACKYGDFGRELHHRLFPEITFAEFQRSQWRKANRYMAIAMAVREKLQIGHVSNLVSKGTFF